MAAFTEDEIKELHKKTEGILLSDIALSTRLYNCLRRNGLTTLLDLMLKSIDEIAEFRNMGKKSLEEANGLRAFVQHADRVTILSLLNRMEESMLLEPSQVFFRNEKRSIFQQLIGDTEGKEIAFKDNSGNLVPNINIDECMFSTRTYKVLQSANIKTLREIGESRAEDIVQLRNLGSNSLEEIVSFLKERIELLDRDVSEKYMSISKMVVDALGEYISEEEKEIVQVKLAFELAEREFNEAYLKTQDGIANMLINSKQIIGILANHINEYINSCGEVNRYELYERFKDINIYDQLMNSIIERLTSSCLIREHNGYFIPYRQYLSEWLEALGEHQGLAIKLRCQGQTLEEVGNVLHVTRERARQIVSKTLERKPELMEDKYAPFFEKYGFTDEEFQCLLDIDTFTINYLKILYKRGNSTEQDVLYDDTFPSKYKRNFLKAFKEKIFILEGICFPLRRDVLIRELLRVYYSERDCTVEEFERFYTDYLLKHDLTDIKLTFPNSRAFAARVQDYDFTLSKYGRRIRYYDTKSIDINQFIKDIGLLEYYNMEISTLKIIRDKQEIIEKYGIFDEYELHNLLKKKESDIVDFELEINRMPFITIGNADRYTQIKELLFQLAPISSIDLASEYEARYGVKAETVIANFFTEIDVYLNGSVFDLEQPDMSQMDKRLMKEALVKEFYLWDELKECYMNCTGKDNLEVINAMTIKRLGYKVYSHYVVKDTYPSAESFYKQLFTKNGYIEIDKIEAGIRQQQLFYAVISELRDSLDIIEVDKNIYITFEWFSNYYVNISKETFKDIGENLLSYRKENYFTLISLKNNGAELDDKILNNPYIVLSSIRLNKQVRVLRAMDNIIYSIDSDISLAGLVESCFVSNQYFAVDDLIEHISISYGILFSRSKLITVILNSNVIIYDGLTQTVLNKEYAERIKVCWYEPRYHELITAMYETICSKNTLLTQILWEDKYAELLEELALIEVYTVLDVLECDMHNIYANRDSTYSKIILANAVQKIIDWVENIGNSRVREEINLFDCFFK